MNLLLFLSCFSLLTLRQTTRALSAKRGNAITTTASANKNAVVLPTTIEVCIPKPLGMVLEEVDANDPSRGVCIRRIHENSNACHTEACINDQIVAVNGQQSNNNDFDEIMKQIIEAPPEENVALTLHRPASAVVLDWPNGVKVAASVGEYLGNIAQDAGYFGIPYDCRSGSCGTCAQWAILDDQSPRLVRPCSFRVPKGVQRIQIRKDGRSSHMVP